MLAAVFFKKPLVPDRPAIAVKSASKGWYPLKSTFAFIPYDAVSQVNTTLYPLDGLIKSNPVELVSLNFWTPATLIGLYL